MTRALEARYEAEKKAERTAESFAGWTSPSLRATT
jgi:hypothetical protein